jgi:hypothetical protein
MTTLQDQFDTLSDGLERLIGLLEEADERFWIPYLRRGQRQVDERKLGGATFVLGCYGGEDTFSDLVIGRHWETQDPLRFRNLNARLNVLRTEVFHAANAITSRRAW